MGLEVAVGFLIAWFARKAGRAWKRVDGITDEVLDAQLDRLCEPIIAKLGGDSALRQLEAEASQTGDAVPRTRERAKLALEEAAEQDSAFAADLKASLASAPTVAISGDVRADGGIAIGNMTGGSVTMTPHPFVQGGRSHHR
jgi:hypothetical protein